MNREGALLSARLDRSTGFPVLDAEALALFERAAPLPGLPKSVPGETVEIVVPVEFFIRR
jgi:protein TonB